MVQARRSPADGIFAGGRGDGRRSPGKKGFRANLRVKGVQGHTGVFEMTWAGDGRATFTYGSEQQPCETHIIWRPIGGHEILKNP